LEGATEMNQTTISADALATGLGHKTSAQSGRSKLAMVIAAALAGAVLALGANAAIGAYQAGIAADQSAQAVSQLNSQRSVLIRSERAEVPAAVSNPDAITNADRSVVRHLSNERAESATWSVPQQGIPAFMQGERDEAPPAWSVPQEGVPSFLKSERDEAPLSH
jgi:hypothetical protein